MTSKGPLFLAFSEDNIVALRSWPEPRAWRKTSAYTKDTKAGAKIGWRGTSWPGLHMGPLLRQIESEAAIAAGKAKCKDLPQGDRPSARIYEQRKRESFRQFLAPVPNEIIEEMRQPYTELDWPVFRLLCQSEEAREACAQGDRALVYALANAREFQLTQGVPGKAFFARWIKKSRRQLASRLGFPDRKSTVKILRKLRLAHVDVHLLRELTNVMRDPHVYKILCHLDEIGAAHLCFLRPDYLKRMTNAFIQSLSDVQSRWLPRDLQRDALDVMRLETQMGLRQPRWTSLGMLRERHDQLVDLARHKMNFVAAELPPPPVELSDAEKAWIVPLQTGYALIEEGAAQDHCLGTLQGHQTRASQGKFYAWALHGDERATLALHRVGNVWALYDVRRAHNERVSPSLVGLARDFVRRANGDSRQGVLPFLDCALDCHDGAYQEFGAWEQEEFLFAM